MKRGILLYYQNLLKKSWYESSGNAYIPGAPNDNNNNNNNPQKIQACAPAPVYVNAPPKPRRSTNMIQPQTMMVTGTLESQYIYIWQ